MDENAAQALVLSIQRMSRAELIRDILRHEREVRGIDWLSFTRQGADGLVRARQAAREYLAKLQKDLGVSDAALPEFTRAFIAGASQDEDEPQSMPEWAIDRSEAETWRSASGDELKDMILTRLKVMQALELSSSDVGAASLTGAIGVVAWVKRAYDAYRIARAAGSARMLAILNGIKAFTLNATRLFVATVIVAVITTIILYLMEKDAVVYMTLINMTDSDLELQELGLTHGNQLVQFEDPLAQGKILQKREAIEGLGVEGEVYWIGLFSARKKDYALYGTQGAFNFKPTTAFPSPVFVGWDIPLTFMGGPNACLVSTTFEGSASQFAGEVPEDGSLESTATTSAGQVTAKMHSGSGSEGYMSVIFSLQ